MPPTTLTLRVLKLDDDTEVVDDGTNAKATRREPVFRFEKVVAPPALTMRPPRAVNSEAVVAELSDELGSTATKRTSDESLFTTFKFPVFLELPPPLATANVWTPRSRATAKIRRYMFSSS